MNRDDKTKEATEKTQEIGASELKSEELDSEQLERISGAGIDVNVYK